MGLFPKKDKEIALQALDRVDILVKTYHRTSDFSGGQMQRVGIIIIVLVVTVTIIDILSSRIRKKLV